MGARSGGGGGGAAGGGGGGQYLKGARRTSNPNTGRDIGSLMGQTVKLSDRTSLKVGRDGATGVYKVTVNQTGPKHNTISYTKNFAKKSDAQSFYNLQVYMDSRLK